MKLAIIGFGRLGKEVCEVLTDSDVEVVLKINTKNIEELNPISLAKVDVALELSGPQAATKNLEFLAQNQVNTVCGSTGWLDNYASITELYKQNETAFLYASNFSLGMNLAFELNRYAAKLFSQFEFTPSIEETHHLHKKDKPSGTAISIAEDLISNHKKLNQWELIGSGTNPSLNNSTLSLQSFREGEVVGDHLIKYDAPYESYVMKHEAIDRKAFAVGAITACKWLHGKKGIYDMKDVLGIKS